MWGRLSLRVQIMALLFLLLAGEALLGSAWLALLLRRALYRQAREDSEPMLAQTARDVAGRCGPAYERACVEPLVETALMVGRLETLRVETPAGAFSSGRALDPGKAPTQAVRGQAGPVVALGVPDTVRPGERAASVFQFHLANMAVFVLALTLLGAAAFNRAVARPVDRLAEVADRIGHLEWDPTGASLDAPLLGNLGTAFERMSRALKAEQQRTTSQIAELTRINRELQDARSSLVRQEKLATVGRLAAGVAHEVGNPLGGILGYAELLKLKGDPMAQEYAERISREVARIDKTVRGLLDFSRPHAAALAPVALQAVVDASLALCRADKRFREVEAEVALAEGLPPVLADEHQLGQVLVNLLLNAGDAMAGKGRVWLRAEREGERVRVLVEDSGPGIPAEALPRIFDPFFTTKEVGQGTGLGLSICASLMDAFGGDLRAENREGGGARFVLHLRAGA